MHKSAAFLGALLFLIPTAARAADRKFDPDAAAKAVAPYLDDRTVAIVHVDLTRLDVDAVAKQLAELAKLKAEELADEKKAIGSVLQALLKAGARDAFLVFSLIDLPTQPPFIVLPVDKDADATAILEALPNKGEGHLFEFDQPFAFEPIGKALVGGSATTRKRLKALKPEPRPEVAKAFAASKNGVARAVVFATTDTRKILEETMPELPPELGGGSIKVLTRGLQWASLEIDAPPQLKVHWLVQATDKDSAKTLLELTKKTFKMLAGWKELRELVPDIDKILEAFMPQLDGERLTLTMDEKTLATALSPAIQKVRESASQRIAMNNLKQLALALHNYHDTHNHFPPVANFDKQKKPLLSWRVQMLPYLEQEKLYKEFHLDEPWDSEHNKKLIAKMPAVFANPTNPKLAAAGKTTYLAVVHPTAVFTGNAKGTRIADITDGTSLTVMLVDAADDAAVIWTKPDDLKLDPKNPAKGLSTRFGDNYLFALADGSVQFIPKKLDKATLNALFTKAGGETVQLP